MRSASDLLGETDLLDLHGREEASKWSVLLGRVLVVAVLFGALVDILEASRTGAWGVLLGTRLAGSIVVVAFVVHLRAGSPRIVDVDGRARGVMWALAMLWAIDVGVSGHPPLGVCVLMTVAAFLPVEVRRLTARRWVIGASAWLVIAVSARCATHGARSIAEAASIAALATGPALFAAFFALGRLFATESRAAAARLESRTIGRYELVRRIGAGGMGEVWEAHHPALKVSVAVKLLRIDTKDALVRFEAEAKTTASLVHPSTVRVYDYGVVGSWLAYYVMERVPGKNLRALVQAEGALPPRRALAIVRQVANALHEAHRKGLVHRDIKPENVLVCMECGEPDLVKIIDFGIVYHSSATASHKGADRLTAPGTVLGTPAYIAPETTLGDDATTASDVYSLGCVLYFLLTARPPFGGSSPQEVIAAHVLDVSPPPSKRSRHQIPGEVDELVARCLAKVPSERPATGRPLIKAIDEAVDSCSSSEKLIQSLPSLAAAHSELTGPESDR